MNYGLATIINANGSMADLDDRAVWKLPDEFTIEELVEALETLCNDATCRHRMGKTAQGIVTRDHDPRVCADRYGEEIERFYLRAASSLFVLPQFIAGIEDRKPADVDLIRLAAAICQSFTPANRPRQLLVDVSELVQRDSESGIQRVVKSVIREWLRNSPENIRVEPVYATTEKSGYYYARHYTLEFSTVQPICWMMLRLSLLQVTSFSALIYSRMSSTRKKLFTSICAGWACA